MYSVTIDPLYVFISSFIEDNYLVNLNIYIFKDAKITLIFSFNWFELTYLEYYVLSSLIFLLRISFKLFIVEILLLKFLISSIFKMI